MAGLGFEGTDAVTATPSTGRNTSAPRMACLDFVALPWFQTCIGIIIALNVIVFGFETDNPEMESTVFVYLESGFLAVYSVELMLRILYKGPVDFFCGGAKESYGGQKDEYNHLWNWLDAFIVSLGVFELWVLQLLARHEDNDTGWTRILRFIRLLRLLRLLRFFKIFQQLMTVVTAFREMLQSFAVTFLVMALFILINAIFCTHLLGKHEAFSRKTRDDEELQEPLQEVQELFSDIPTSTFTLFRVTTTDNWILIARPVMKLDPIWGLFFIFFILSAAWTMLSVLTAVASDSMVTAASFRQEMEAREEEEKRKDFRAFLQKSFHEADDDKNGHLDRDEFKKLIKSDSLTNYMRNLGINIQTEDLERAWEMLDVDKSGELTIDEFVVGLAYLQEGLSTKHVKTIDVEINRVRMHTEDRLERLSAKVSEMLEHNHALKDELKKQTEFHARHCKILLSWLAQAQQSSPEDFPKEVMDAARHFLRPPTNNAEFAGFKQAWELAEITSSRAASSFGMGSRQFGRVASRRSSQGHSHEVVPMRSIPLMAISPG